MLEHVGALRRSDYELQKGEGNKKAMKIIIDSGDIPGILGFTAGVPVAWCSVAPKENFSLIERSHILKPIDDKSVWSITYIFITKSMRRKGITSELLYAALDNAKKNGAKIIEGYPLNTNKDNYPVVLAGTGFY